MFASELGQWCWVRRDLDTAASLPNHYCTDSGSKSARWHHLYPGYFGFIFVQWEIETHLYIQSMVRRRTPQPVRTVGSGVWENVGSGVFLEAWLVQGLKVRISLLSAATILISFLIRLLWGPLLLWMCNAKSLESLCNAWMFLECRESLVPSDCRRAMSL